MVAEWGTQLEIELLSSPQPVGPMVRLRAAPSHGGTGERGCGEGRDSWSLIYIPLISLLSISSSCLLLLLPLYYYLLRLLFALVWYILIHPLFSYQNS